MAGWSCRHRVASSGWRSCTHNCVRLALALWGTPRPILASWGSYEREHGHLTVGKRARRRLPRSRCVRPRPRGCMQPGGGSFDCSDGNAPVHDRSSRSCSGRSHLPRRTSRTEPLRTLRIRRDDPRLGLGRPRGWSSRQRRRGRLLPAAASGHLQDRAPGRPGIHEGPGGDSGDRLGWSAQPARSAVRHRHSLTACLAGRHRVQTFARTQRPPGAASRRPRVVQGGTRGSSNGPTPPSAYAANRRQSI